MPPQDVAENLRRDRLMRCSQSVIIIVRGTVH